MEKLFSFIVVAGGSASRMGGAKKQFMILNNRPVWKWSADAAVELYESGIREVILVLPESENINADWENDSVPLRIAHGGSERSLSVLNGLKAARYDYAMIHDAARPFVSKDLLLELLNSTSETAGAIPVLPVSDALKKIDVNKKVSCVNRDELYITQTPQSFPRISLIEALRKKAGVKDEAEAWLSDGHELNYVYGERLNFKITWPDDMKIAKAVAENKNKVTRTGIGWDIHRLVPERKLILGGISVQNSPLGLLGHSDADVLTHAVMDAILGAAGLPDIGNLFPASDEKFKNADSIGLLKKVMDLVQSKGWHIEWIDAVIQAQIPRLNAYIPEMKNKLENLIGSEKVNIKVKSAEKIDDAGAGLSMTCQAIATLSGVIV